MAFLLGVGGVVAFLGGGDQLSCVVFGVAIRGWKMKKWSELLKYDTISLKDTGDLDVVDHWVGVNDDAIIKVDASQSQDAIVSLGGKIVCTFINLDKLHEARRKSQG